MFNFFQRAELWFFQEWPWLPAQNVALTSFSSCVRRVLCQLPRTVRWCEPWVRADGAPCADGQIQSRQKFDLFFSDLGCDLFQKHRGDVTGILRAAGALPTFLHLKMVRAATAYR